MTRLVYGTGSGCPETSREKPRRSLPPGEHDVRVRRERAGRRGKTVTVAGPFHLSAGDSRDLLKRLKRVCGSGGTAKKTDLEIQGDHVERVITELTALGYRAKRSGG